MAGDSTKKRRRKSKALAQSRSKRNKRGRAEGKTEEKGIVCYDERGDAFWEAETIVDMRQRKDGAHEYRVRWKGFPPSEDTWEPESNLCDSLYDYASILKNRGTVDKLFEEDSADSCATSATEGSTSPDHVFQDSEVDTHEAVDEDSYGAEESDRYDATETENSDPWKWTDSEQLMLNDIERIDVNDPDACRRVTMARLSGIPVCLVGHKGWANFSQRWLKPKGQNEVVSAENPSRAENLENETPSDQNTDTLQAVSPDENALPPADIISTANSENEASSHTNAMTSKTLPPNATKCVPPGADVIQNASEAKPVEELDKGVKSGPSGQSFGEWLDLNRDWELDTAQMIADIGDETVPVVKHNYNEHNPIHAEIKLSKFLQRGWPSANQQPSQKKASRRVYLHQWQFPLSTTAAAKLCGPSNNNPLPNNIFGEDLLSYWLDPQKWSSRGDSPYQYLFMGREGTMSKMHKDNGGMAISIAPIVGEKEVVLVHRSDGACLYHLDADIDKVDLHRFPLLCHARIFRTVVKPGEILVMPQSTYHQCRNITPCLSYSRFHLDTVNLKAFFDSMIDEDAKEVSHPEVIWNSTTELFKQVDEYVNSFRTASKSTAQNPPEKLSSDIVRKVDTLRALRNICREIEMRCEEQNLPRPLELESEAPACSPDITTETFEVYFSKATHWSKLIKDVDSTLHDFRHRRCASIPPFRQRRGPKPSAKSKLEKMELSSIEEVFSSLPAATGGSLPTTAILCLGNKVEVNFNGRLVNGIIKQIKVGMQGALLQYDGFQKFHNEWQPLRHLRFPGGGESTTTAVRLEDLEPGKRVVHLWGEGRVVRNRCSFKNCCILVLSSNMDHSEAHFSFWLTSLPL
jgi:hypothetical protein